jgi:predicted MFS family arabinose efflux permease
MTAAVQGSQTFASFATPATIGLIGFLTLIDLFGTQAILPTLAQFYGVSPAAAVLAVNASTIGMAAAGLLIVFMGRNIPRRAGVVVCLALLAIPTSLLAFAPDLEIFAVLRVVQGIFMASAFSLTMAYLAERCSAAQSATALAAYVTGAVASNLFGRLAASMLAEKLGLAANFYAFASLNLCGAALAYVALKSAPPMQSNGALAPSALAVIGAHLKNACLRTSFAIGFLILFAFVGIFSYVNFTLAAPPFDLAPMALGTVYVILAPAMLTTPFAGRVAARFGARRAFLLSLGISIASLPLLAATSLATVLIGMTILGAGTFFAQATATGFVGRAAKSERAAASGLYLTSYYLGGLAGAALPGYVYERFGWTPTLAVVGAALASAAALAMTLERETAA